MDAGLPAKVSYHIFISGARKSKKTLQENDFLLDIDGVICYYDKADDLNGGRMRV